MLLDHESRMLATLMQRAVAQKKQRFAHLAAALDAMSPLKVLGRGYSLVRTEDGSVVQRAEQLRVGETLEITLRKGSVSAEVREIREGQRWQRNRRRLRRRWTRLEAIVRAMEQGNVPLEESLKLFQEGTGWCRACTKLLDKAELEVVKLMKGPDGEPVEQEFVRDE